MTDDVAVDSGESIPPSVNLEMVWIDPGAAQQNPKNWKRHGDAQMLALADLIYADEDDENAPGTAVPAIVNDRRVEMGWAEDEAVPTLLDGHARDILAEEYDEPFLAVVGSWSPQQEVVVLATLDPLIGMASTDSAAYLRVLQKVETSSDVVQRIIDDTADAAGLFQERMQGVLGVPNTGLGGYRAGFASSSGVDDEFDLDDILDPKGKIERNFEDSAGAMEFVNWHVIVSDDEVSGLTAFVDKYIEETGMSNGCVRAWLEGLYGDTLENLIIAWQSESVDGGEAHE